MGESFQANIHVSWFRQTKRLGLSFWLPSAWIAFVLLLAISADFLPLPPYDHIDWAHPAAEPGTRGVISRFDANGIVSEIPHTYWLGTDTLGRDIAARLIYGARVSLLVGLLAPVISFVIGGILGLLAGFYRGRLESVVVAVMDTILAFPGLVLLLAITFYLGPALPNLIAALAVLIVPAFCRVARASTLTWAQRDFIMAARAVGASDLRVLISHLLPNVMTTMAAYGLLLVAVMIIAEGALSFLGLGVPAPIPSWGGMIAEGKEILDEAPHVSMIPAVIMFLTVLSFNLLGDRLRELTDIRNISGRE